MYQDKKISINWFKIGLRIVLLLLIILLSIKLISIIGNNKTNVVENNDLAKNMEILEGVIDDYFNKDNLPTKTGDSNKVTLNELIKAKKVEKLKTSKSKCDVKKTYIKVTKLDKEYQYKINIECGKEKDKKNIFKEIKDIKPTTTTTTTTKKVETTTKKVTTTAKPTTTTKTYNVSFNSNGGTYINDQKIKANNTIQNVVPTREGYTFIGWFYHGSEFNINTKINQDYVLTAKWVMN